MVLLRDATLVLALFGFAFALCRLLTKACWACKERLPRWRQVCSHCGRRERAKP